MAYCCGESAIIGEERIMSTVLVTGANRGLGLEFCRQYAAAGWKVLACCRKPAAAEELNALAAIFPAISIHAVDLRHFAEIDALAHMLADEPIDILLSNAGVYGDTSHTAFGSLDYQRWQDVFVINTQAPVKLAEAFVHQVALSQRKLIVAVTSLMGSVGDNTSGGSIMYRSSKAGPQRRHEKRGDRPESPRYRRSDPASRLGQDRHGRPAGADLARRERFGNAPGDGSFQAGLQRTFHEFSRRGASLVRPRPHL
jgi:nucleoside-diphosphate-sugar epimerase